MSEMNPQNYYSSLNRVLKSVEIDLDDVYSTDRVFIAPKDSKGYQGGSKENTHSLSMISESEEITGLERSQMLMEALNNGAKLYVYAPGADYPRQLTVEAKGPVLSDVIGSLKPVKEPTIQQPKRPGVFARFANWITRGKAYRSAFEKYEQDMQEYSDAQEKYAADVQAYNEKKAVHDEAARTLSGVSRIRNKQDEIKHAREMREKHSTAMTVDELSDKQPEQVKMERSAQPSMQTELTSSKK